MNLEYIDKPEFLDEECIVYVVIMVHLSEGIVSIMGYTKDADTALNFKELLSDMEDDENISFVIHRLKRIKMPCQ